MMATHVYKSFLYGAKESTVLRVLLPLLLLCGYVQPTVANDVVEIPVVFHLIYGTGTPSGTKANIPDSKIEQYLQELNDNFAHASGETFSNPYSGIDTKIRFILAKRDPQGNATNGIIRHPSNTHSTITSFQDEPMMSAYGWDQSSYINIYAVDKLIGSSGYSRFPGFHGQTVDGILFNGESIWGGIMTHEMGHYLGLYHIFSDVGSSENDNCAEDGDGICDTPPKSKAGTNGGTCDNPNNTSTTDADDTHERNPFRPVALGGLGDVPDMLENYMDYTGGCWGAFSHGQSEKMNNILRTARRSLLTSEGGIALSANEVSIVSLVSPNGQLCTPVNEVQAEIKNLGTTDITSLPLSLKVNGSVQNAITWTGTLTPGDSETVSLGDGTFTNGVNDIEVFTDWVDDGEPSNNSATGQVELNAPIEPCDSRSDFEYGLGIWSVENPDNIVAWEVTDLANCSTNGGKVLAYLSNNGTTTGSSGTDDYFVSRPLDLTNASTAEMSFRYAYRRTWSNFSTQLSVEVSDNCGQTYTSVFSKQDNRLETVPKPTDHMSSFTPQSCAQWKTATIDLDAYAGKTIFVRFHINIEASWGQNLYVDNINFTADCNALPDCNGDPGGAAELDECGECAGGKTGVTPGESCADCNGDPNGTATIDACGVCTGGNTGLTPGADCIDCNGDLNGLARIDDCGVCAGGNTGEVPNTTCLDCNGDINGTAALDGCGVCAGGNTGRTPRPDCLDCNGEDHGTAEIDACGVCAGGSTGLVPNETCTDCNGMVNGTAFIDACGVCAEGNTGIVANSTCLDCNGDINGTASIDDCGVCSEGNTGLVKNESCTDCNGDLNGTAGMDACGVCHSGNTGVVSTCYDCMDVEADAVVFCASGSTVELHASNEGNNCDNIKWYEDNDKTSTPIATGCDFTSPPVTTSRSFFVDDISDAGNYGATESIAYQYGSNKLFNKMNRWNSQYQTEFKVHNNTTLKEMTAVFSNCNNMSNAIRVILENRTTGRITSYDYTGGCSNNVKTVLKPEFQLKAGNTYRIYFDQSMGREVIGYGSIAGSYDDVSNNDITILRSGDNLNGGFGPFFDWKLPALCPRKEVKVIQRCLEQCGNGIDDDGDGNIDEACDDFVCNGKYFQTLADSLVQLNISPLSFTTIAKFPFKLNSTGYNPNDNRIYTMAKSGIYDLHVVRVATDGSYEILDQILKPNGDPLSSYSADIGYNGVYYVLENGERILYEVDIETLLAKPVVKGISQSLADIAYNPEDGCLYGISAYKYLHKLDPIAKTETRLGRISASGIINGGGVGAVYFLPSGDLIAYGSFFSSTTQDDMLRISLEDYSAEVLSKNGLKVSENDGASCPYTVSIEKTISDEDVNPGGKFIYTLDVYNQSGFMLYNLDLQDEIDPRLTITDIVTNDLGPVKFNTGVGTQELSVEHFQLPSGKSTIAFEVELQDDIYCEKDNIANQATISNVPAVLGNTIYSDDPTTPAEKDSTIINIKTNTLGLKKGTLTVDELSICHGTEQSIVLAGHYGQIVWQQSADGVTWKEYDGVVISDLEITPYWENQTESPLNMYFRVKLRSNCDSIYNEISVEVLPQPYTEAGVVEKYICEGTDIALTAGDAGTGATYEWAGPDGFTSTDQNPIISATTEDQTGTYTVIPTLGGCVGDQEEVQVTVLKPAEVTITPLPSATICPGETIDFSSTVTSSTPTTDIYQWFVNGVQLPEEIRSTFSNNTFENGDIVSLTVSQDGVCTSEAEQTVTVKPQPILDLGDTAKACDEYTINAPTGFTTYLWEGGETTESLTVTESGDYPLTVTLDGCETSDTLTVNIYTTPDFAIGNDTALCIVDSLLLDAKAGSQSYLWNTGDTTQTIYGKPGNSYTVTATTGVCETIGTITLDEKPQPVITFTGDFIVCPGTPATITASGADSYEWENGDATASFTTSPTEVKDHKVIGTFEGCVDSAFQKVDLRPIPDVIASDDETICFGKSTDISVSGTAAVFTWDNALGTGTSHTVSPTEVTTYRVSGTLHGCTVTDSVIVSVNPKIIVTPGVDTAICIGTEFVLNAAGNAISYEWDNGLGSGQTHTVSPTTDTKYHVTATFNGCTLEDSVSVLVKPLPVVSLSGILEICPEEPTVLTATGADTYAWNTAEATESITVSPTVDSVYKVVGTTNGCSTAESVTVTLKPLPIVEALEDFTICYDKPTTLTATGTATGWLWDNGLGAGATHSIAPLVSTEYIVQGTLHNCISYDTVMVVVNPQIKITPGADTVICLGDSFELKASGNALSFEWDNGLGIGDHTVSPTTDTRYSVTATFNGCTLEDSRFVTVNSLPIISANADESDICIGESTSISATGGVSYIWDSGETTTHTVSPTTTSIYFVTGTDINSCSIEASVSVTVHDLPEPTITTNTRTDEVCVGDIFTLSTEAYATYVWSTTETTQTVSVTDEGTHTYNLTVTSVHGCEGSVSKTVIVHPYPIVDLGDDELLCINESLEKELSIPNATYRWNNRSTADRILILPPGGNYWVEATVNGCTTRDDIQVSFTNLPDYEIVGDTVIHEGDSAYFHVTKEFASYLWNTGLKAQYISTKPSVNAPSAVDYWVMVTDEYSCKKGDTLSIKVTTPPVINLPDLEFCSNESRTLTAGEGFDTYVWNTGEITRSITVSEGGTYWVKGYKYYPSLTVIDTSNVIVHEVPGFNLGLDESICPDESITLTGSDADRYMWNTGATTKSITVSAPGEYILTVSNGTDCDYSDDIIISQTPFSNPPRSQGIVYCTNGSAKVLSSQGENIRWFDANKQLLQDDMGTINFETADTGTTQFYVTQNYNGCESDFAPVTVKAVEPDESIKISGESTYCAPQLRRYYKVLEETQAVSWFVSETNSILGSSENDRIISLDFFKPVADTLSIMAIDTNGCKVNDTLVIYVSGDPEPVFDSDANFGLREISHFNLTEEFVIPNTDITIPNTHYWHFGRPNDKMVQHSGDTIITYAYGFHNVTLKTINAFGCKDSIIQRVFMDVPATTYTPDAFSPTHDSRMLREFRVFGTNMVEFEMYIYDVWGNTIWFTNMLKDGQPSEVWTGVYGEGIMPAGSYVWKMRGQFENGEEFEEFGNVLLMR